MKLLIITQTVDATDPTLGFFVRWVEELSKKAKTVEVVCLKEGEHHFQGNVRVHSLGKERGVSRVGYLIHLYKLVWHLRHDYDSVFVHMNQEYILLAGWLWRILGKRVHLWRNHYAGSWLTRIAVLFCTKVFCTSRYSYTARFQKTVLMPVGVDTERFFPNTQTERTPHSILFLARMSPAKRPEMFIDALSKLVEQGHSFTATLVGTPLPEDETYYERLKEQVRSRGLVEHISFSSSVPHHQTPDVYRAHELFVNTSRSGMFDKTLFEAAACECLPLAASKDWKELAGEDLFFEDADMLARRLVELFSLAPREISKRAVNLHTRVVDTHALSRLGEALFQAME